MATGSGGTATLEQTGTLTGGPGNGGMLTIEPPVLPRCGEITQPELDSMTRALWLYRQRDIINEEITIAGRGLPAPFAFAGANGGPGQYATAGGTIMPASIEDRIVKMLKGRGAASRVPDIARAVGESVERVTEILTAGVDKTFESKPRGYWGLAGG